MSLRIIMNIQENEFRYIADVVAEHSGIVISQGEEYLVESRLLPLAQGMKLSSIGELVKRLQANPFGSDLLAQVVDAMAISETSFFRDRSLFEILRKRIIPDLIDRRSHERQLNIWCGACSTGQEPYSLAMLLKENFPMLARWTTRIVGSDLSKPSIARARQGIYTQIEVSRGLPPDYLVKYFQRGSLTWQIDEKLREMVEFVEINLVKNWQLPSAMDIVLLRNVLIYFSIENKKRVLAKIRRVLRPDGFLFLGSAETTVNLDDTFQIVPFDKVVGYRL